MSIYEKIASVILALVLIVIVVASYHEFKEPKGPGGSDFDQSLGQDFNIGPFATVVSEHYSGGLEQDCVRLQPVIIAALHDISGRLKLKPDTFEVNQQALQLFCNKNAEVVLGDGAGNTLILHKAPFTRAVPQNGTADDIGTDVRIEATLVPAGAPVPAQPTTYGDVLIPDRFLDR